MGQFIDIDPDTLADIRTATYEGISFIIDNFSRSCQLFYPAVDVICPNCIVDPRSHASTGRYKMNGPEPFPLGDLCPICEGRGFLPGNVASDTIKLLLDFSPKQWQNIGGSPGTPDELVRLPNGLVSSKGYIEDLPKVLRCSYIIMDVNANYQGNRYKLYGEPILPSNIVQNKFFVANWTRAQG